jgi:hypothetical protein
MKKSNKDKGNEFEKECQRTINSGAFFKDHDLSTNSYCVECKFSEAKGFRISTKILEKLWEDAFTANKLPLLLVGIKDGNTQYNLRITISKEIK